MHLPAASADAPPERVHVGRVTALAVIAALGGFLFGYDSSVINGANKAIYERFDVTAGLFQGFVVSVALLGSAVGAFVGGRLAQRYGRKRVMLIAAVLFLIAGLGSAFPITIWDFMAWRIVGISLGLAYGLFTLFAVLSFFFVWKWVTETRGTELEEMDELEGIELDDDASVPA